MRLSEADSPRVLRPPRLNGRYVVTRLLGKGAQARVYLAMDARLKQWRAVKVLAPEYVSDEQVRHRFEKEAEAMARLSHRNLLRILDIDTDGGLPFIVMELARAGAVTDWLKRHGPMPPHLAIDVIAQACEGLAHAHRLGVVHRDVKPHNLLIADDGRILLTDFGIAQLSEDASLTQTGSVLGTFAYMAPEQRNDTKSVDARTDVYALGATLYTCLTLRTSAELFFAENRDEILEGIPEELAVVILDACKYDREERLGSVMRLRERLIECRGGLTEVECPPIQSQIMPVPDRPPKQLAADSGVEELLTVLAAHGLDTDTYIPRSRAEMLFEEQSTTLYSDTGYDDDDDFQLEEPESSEPLPPFVEPDVGVTVPSEIPDIALRMRAQAELGETDQTEPVDVSDGARHGNHPPVSGGFERTGTTRTGALRRAELDHHSVRRPLLELSEEDVPSYVDVSTLDRPTPQIDEPRPSTSSHAPLATASGAAAARRPVVAADLHTAEPAKVRMHRDRKQRTQQRALLGAVLGMTLVTLLVCWGMLAKMVTSYQANLAGRHLMQVVHEQQIVITELDAAGVERAPIEARWFAIQDAPPEAKTARAAEFAELVTELASQHALRGIAGTQAAQLRNAIEDWDTKVEAAQAAREGLPARMTGSLGVFPY